MKRGQCSKIQDIQKEIQKHNIRDTKGQLVEYNFQATCMTHADA